MPSIHDSDFVFLERARRRLGVKPVVVLWSESKAKWPDIWCVPSRRTITVTQEWRGQPKDERRKRLVHELLHLKGMGHGGIYSTYPKQDSFSRKVYEKMKRNPLFEAAITGLGFGAGYKIAEKVASKVIKNPVSSFRKGDVVRLRKDPRRQFTITKVHHLLPENEIWYNAKERLGTFEASLRHPKTLTYDGSEIEIVPTLRNPVIRTKANNPLLAQLRPGKTFKHQGLRYTVTGGPTPWGRDDVLVPVRLVSQERWLEGTLPGRLKVK